MDNIKGQLDILRRTVDRGLVYAEQNKISRMVDMCHHLKDEIQRTYLLLNKASKKETTTWDTHENVDRQGGSFSASEIENATAWR